MRSPSAAFASSRDRSATRRCNSSRSCRACDRIAQTDDASVPLNHAIAGYTGTTRTNHAAVLMSRVCAMADDATTPAPATKPSDTDCHWRMVDAANSTFGR